MAVKITCPKCQTAFMVAEAFAGSKIQCPQCNATLILGLESDHSHQHYPIPKPAIPTKLPEDKIRPASLAYLSQWLDLPTSLLQQAMEMLARGEAYTIWDIPKGDGKAFRRITAPCPLLKHIQRRILDRLLYRIPVSNAAHGFVQGRSIVTNAKYHLQTAQSILNLDLKDAFPSVSDQRIKHLYVRYLKIPLLHLGEGVSHQVLDDVIDLLVLLTTYNHQLPQGGPCSGYLLNIACLTLDKNIYRLMRQYGENYRYSRYADDITVSVNGKMSAELQTRLQKLIHDCGFQVNPQKCQYAERTRGKCLEVTGLILEKDQVRIPPRKLNEFRAIIHQASITPVEKLFHDKRLEVQSIVAFIKMVYEKIPFRIWKPYKAYLDKVGVPMPKGSEQSVSLYPKAKNSSTDEQKPNTDTSNPNTPSDTPF